ncbi:FCD domain-containing protein [Anaerocolumna sedimenticola]|uniref:FCD domain-containing protein n=1 Tax=Anaerocolumna sedimenticola TaxID=2696063 RepID=A0A6P1TLP0_9FIRM|nr:FadR/GntR family transcriptional regulator [Anaerocolumna sedimenticola]QHQ61079.1 FCD domain-containing protein [Anaerocolumna sedimenticola]
MTEAKKDSLPPIGKESIVQQVVTRIIDLITNGHYKVGSKLPNEYELIKEMQISRNSLREAMKILEAMGIVEIKRGDGTYVCSQINPNTFDKVIYSLIFDLSTSSELLELRQVLDESIVRLVITKITSEEIDALEQNIRNMRLAINNNDTEAAEEYDYEFHMLLIDACKNTFFIRIAKGVYQILKQSIGENIHLERVNSLAPDYHEVIVECIKNKDYTKISEVVSNSLLTWRERI